MTIEQNPTPRPSDSFTAQDGARLFGLMDELKKHMEKDISFLRGQITEIQKDIIEIKGTQSRIETGLSDTRYTRLENELKEAELEKERAEVALRTAQEKINIKQNATGNGTTKGDTGERFRSLAKDAIEERDRAEQERKKKERDDLILTAKKTFVSWGVVGLAVSFFGFLWFLIQLYVNRGAP